MLNMKANKLSETHSNLFPLLIKCCAWIVGYYVSTKALPRMFPWLRIKKECVLVECKHEVCLETQILNQA